MAADERYIEEISTLTQRVTTLEDERATLLRRIDLSEEARMAAESGSGRRRGSAPARRTRPLPPSAPASTGTGRGSAPAPPAPRTTPSRTPKWWQRIRE